MTNDSAHGPADSGRTEKECRLRSAVLRGNEQAWEMLYNDSYHALSRYVGWKCLNYPDHVEEVLQETWLTAVRKLGHFDPARASFATWLRGIAANMIRNRIRNQKQQAATRQDIHALALFSEVAVASNDISQQEDQIALTLSLLPDNYEAVLREKYLEQRSVNEIAVQLSQTPKAIESLLSRARDRFRAVYLRLDRDESSDRCGLS